MGAEGNDNLGSLFTDETEQDPDWPNILRYSSLSGQVEMHEIGPAKVFFPDPEGADIDNA